MPNLEQKVPPLSVAIIFGAAMWGVSNYLTTIPVPASSRVIAAVVIALIGVFFSAAGIVSFRRARTTVNPLKPETASSLVTSGIYQFTRNPMYVGFALFLVAWAFFLASPLTLFGAIGFVLYLNRFQIAPEERALAGIFGVEFEHYKQSVSRWV